ncbi:MAG: calcium-binding protein [Burkholderiales bacterium]
MANVQFGNTAADMRLVNDFYGIPALGNFATYVDNFVPVRQEIVSVIPRIVIREFNAAGESITVSAAGTLPTGPFSDLAVEAIGIRAAVNGAIFLAPDGSVSGTATALSVVNVGDGSLIVQVSGISAPIDDISFEVDSIVLAGNDTVTSGSGNDYLLGYGGDDTVSSQGGNDYLEGGAGKDALNGGSGLDTAVFSAPQSQYTVLAAPDGRVAVAYDPRGGDALDVLSGVEQGSFAGALVALNATASVLEYVASHADLMNAFGANAQAGFDHYVNAGYAEGRAISFNALEYIASYGDLANAFGANADAGAGHYIQAGRFEGRSTSFDGLEYIASYGDLIKTFGANGDAGATHYIGPGHTEGRHVTFDGLEYIASHSDLINAFHNQVAASPTPEDIGATHYIGNGFAEHRAADSFDAAQYLANYADLQAVFGANTEAATIHYITAGYFEDRTDHAPS